MNKTETSRISLIEQPNVGCSRYVALQDVLSKIEGTAVVLIIATITPGRLQATLYLYLVIYMYCYLLKGKFQTKKCKGC
jgi:hypothetical protein